MTVMYVRALNLLTSCISQGGGDVVHTERLCDLCPRLPSAPLRHASPYVNAVSASIDLRLDEQTCGSQPLDKRSQGALLALSDLSATQGATLLPSVLAYLSSIALYNPAPDSHTVYRLCLSVAQQTAHPTSAQAIVVALQSALAAPADHHAILHGVLEALSEQVVSGAGPALRPLLFAALAACIQQVELAAKLKASVTSRSERGPARRSYERWTATQTLAISSISLQLVRDDILDAKVVGRLYQMGLHVLGFTRSGNGEGAAEQIDGLPSDLSALRTQSGHLTVPMMVACVGLTVSCAIPVPDRAADLLQCLFKLMRSAVRPGSDSSMRKCKPVWRAMLQGITRLVVNDVALIAQAVEQLKALLETPDVIAHPDHEELHEDVSSALATILRAELQMPNRNFTDMIARKLVFSLDNTLLMSTSDQDDTASGTEQSLLLLLGRVTSMVNHPKVTEHVLPMLINKFSNSPKLLHIVIPHLTSIALVSEPRIFNDVVSLLTNIYSKPFIPDNKWNRKEIPDALLQLATRVTSAELRSGLLKSLLKLFKTLGRQIQERMEQSAIYNFSSMAGALGFLLPSLSALMDPRPSSRLADRAHSRSPWESDIASRPTTVTLFDAVDADVKWFRSLWNYLVLYKFADCGQPNLWPPAWAVAVKTIASRTPSLALSSCSPSSASTGSHDLDRFSESGLSQVGLADLRARLAALLPAHATASTTLSVGAVSYVMTIEALESLRASTGTFTNMFDYLHDQTSATVSKMVDAVADNVFQLFLEALSSWPAGSPRRLNLESHAVFLFGACCSRYRRVSVKASEYLKELVTRFPFLQWSRPCLFALFDAVAAVQSTTAGLDLIAADGRSSTGWTTLRVPPLDLPDDAKSRLLISQTMQKTLQRWLDNAAFVVPSHLSSLLQIYVQELQYAAPDDVSPSFGITSSLRSILAGKRNVVRALVCPADADPASANLLQSLATRQRYLGQVRGQFHAHCRSRNKTVPGTPFGEVMARGLLDEFHDVLAKYRRTGAVTRAVLAQFERGMFLSAALLVWSVQAPVPEDEDAAAFSDTPLAVHREVDPRELMHLVCMAPVYMFTEAAMQVATATWSWLFAVSHAFSVGLLVTMVPAWSHTVDSQLGLFSGTKDASAQFDGCLFTRIGSYFRPDERVAACHDLWIQFLIDRFDTLSDRSLGSLRAVESMLHKALSRPDRLSCAPFAFGPRFRLLYLGLRMVGSVRHTDLTLLHDRVMACAFAWFYDGPRWSPHTNWADVVRDAATIATFIESVRACAGSAATTRSAAPATTPSAASTGRVATAYAASSSSIRDTSSVHGGSVRQTVRSEAPHKAASLVTDPGPGYGNVPTPNRQASEYSDAPWGLRTSAVNDQVTVGVRRHSSNADLLILLLSHEFHRLVAWHNPRRSPDLALRDENLYAYNIGAVGSEEARRYFHLAWHIDPRLAYRLAQRLSWVPQLRTLIRARIQTHPLAFANVAESVRLLANAKNCKGNAPQLKHLALFESCSLPTALRLLCQPYADCETVTQYTMRSLGRHAFTGVIFYMSEIIQALRHDRFGSLARFLLRAGTLSPHLAHQLIWALQTEAVVDESPRSRQAPNDPLPAICAQLEQQVVASLPDAAADFYRAEFAFIASITRLSSDLLEIPKPMKEERRAELQRQLQRVRAEALESARHPLYLPTDHTAQVVDILVPTAKPLQSAARVPFLVEFLVRSATTTTTTTPAAAVSTKQVIFKAGDDCRQDCLALQFIRLAKDVFASVGLPLFVYPYLVIPNRTGPTRDLGGVIECVRRSASRDELGKSNGLSLRDYFLSKYGRAEGAAFKQAQRNFVLSMAGYAVCCYLLQVKDRHNGNILLDDDGHVVHIDFGFIFDISPAKDMKFEPGGFKLTLEMVEVMDNYDSDLWNWFVELCARGYLAVRAHRDDFLSIADLMSASALGCFKADSVANLKQRFAPDKNERDAAQHMINVVLDSYNNFRTNTYDSIQYLQQGIYYYNQS